MPENLSNTKSTTYNGIFQFVGRFITAAIVLAITAFFTPGWVCSRRHSAQQGYHPWQIQQHGHGERRHPP